MPNDPDDDTGTEDIDPADLDDLGELGDDEDDDSGDEGKEYVAPTADEYAKLQRKLKRQEDRITRLVGRKGGKPAADVDRKLAAQLKGSKADEDDDEPADTAEADRWKGIAIQQAASAQIAAAGFTGTAKQAARLARLLDTSDLEPSRDGTFDLEDEVDELVEEYPELFNRGKGGRRPAPSVRRADVRAGRPKADPSRATSDQLLKMAGYK
jgi:hypothetical protein